MIRHDIKCIFINIQATAGTYIERWLQGEDQWNIKHNWKHVTTKFAKERLYSEYWDDYFKFTFVRNPYERVLEETTTAEFYRWRHVGINEIDVDYRFLNINPMHYFDIHCNGGAVINKFGLDGWEEEIKENCIYKNILSQGVDKVYKYEEYESAVKDIANILNIDIPSDSLDLNTFKINDPNLTVDKLKPRDFEVINNMYDLDFEEYGYEKRFV